MQTARRTKPYKAADPLYTIHHARGILARLGLFTLEHHAYDAQAGVYCCRVYLGDEDIRPLNIGTNGKGITPRLALASAYGEFMERLQNGVLFPLRQMKFATRQGLAQKGDTDGFARTLEAAGLLLDYQFAPDEQYLDTPDLAEKCGDVVGEMFGIDDKAETRAFLEAALPSMKTACVPFYSVTDAGVRQLPAKVIWNTCGTNGMCAGNTPEEAILQGTCEIFERYALRLIFKENPTPPSVPPAWFSGSDVLHRLEAMAAAGYDYDIKDCSLERGLPVIGLVLRRQCDGATTFHLGADPSPVTALERCLTEIFQGTAQENDSRFGSQRLGDIPRREDHAAFRAYMAHYYDATMTGTGKWPDSVFAPTASYDFNGFAHPVSASDTEDLQYILRIVKMQGCRLFVRDCSYLGFPAYQVFIPGMSETDFNFEGGREDFIDWMRLVRAQPTLLNLPRATAEEVRELALALLKCQRNSASLPFQPERWFLSNNSPFLHNLNTHCFTAFLCGYAGLYQEAAQCLRAYMDTSDSWNGPRRFYAALASYWSRMAGGRPQQEALEAIGAEYGQPLAQRCAATALYPGDPSEARWPTCFCCEACQTVQNCLFRAVLSRVCSVQQLCSENIPNQHDLKPILSEVRYA